MRSPAPQPQLDLVAPTANVSWHRTAWRRGLWLLTLALACGLSLLFPGDAPWINDEPLLLGSALTATNAHALASHGIFSRGIYYGPAPTWFYQALLLFSHDPLVLVVVHAAVLSLTTALALAWLAREYRFSLWFVPIVACSPYLWLYNRLLWDNTFNIALSMLALTSYATFVSRRSRPALLLAVACLRSESHV